MFNLTLKGKAVKMLIGDKGGHWRLWAGLALLIFMARAPEIIRALDRLLN